jgi:putative hemolysin
MNGRFSTLVFVLTLSVMIVSGCGTVTPEPTTGMANPASVYCEGQGYTLEMRTDADGGQHGVCVFPDGSECEEWTFYRGECGPVPSDVEQPVEVPTVAPTEVPTVQPTETPAPVEPAETWVYVDLMPDESGTTLTWADSLGGAANSVPAPGARYRVLGEWVYYQEGTSGTVHRVNEAGQDERFDFMALSGDSNESVTWAISPDGSQIVWLRGLFEQDANGEVTLTSALYVAPTATGETRLLTTYVAHEHWFLAPWAFSPDGARIFVYLWPFSVGTVFPTYGGFGVLDIVSGELEIDPPSELYPGPAAALSDDGTRLVRFEREADLGYYRVNLTDVASGQTTEITTIPLGAEPVNPGDALFSPDSSTLVYVVAYGNMGSMTFALFQIDAATGTQRELLSPRSERYRVVHFEDDGSLLLTAVWPQDRRDTWRLHPDGTLEHVSELTLVGISE